MWTKDFWKATAERMVRGGAGALLSAWVVGDGQLDLFAMDAERGASLFLGGAVVSLLFSLIGGAASGDKPASPALVAPEYVEPR